MQVYSEFHYTIFFLKLIMIDLSGFSEKAPKPRVDNSGRYYIIKKEQ